MGMLKFPICIFVLSSLLSSCISQISPSEQRCSGRKILTSNNGKISDGLDNYTQYSRCEWLIDGKNKQMKCVDLVTLPGLMMYSHEHSVINHCDRHITLLSDTDIYFGLFNLFTYFIVHFE